MSLLRTSKFSVIDFSAAHASAANGVKTAAEKAGNSSKIGRSAALPVSEDQMLSSPTRCEELLADLTSHGIQYTVHDHAAAFTVEEQASVVGHLPGVLTKNLFLKDKKFGFYLITVAAGSFKTVLFFSMIAL